MTNIQLKPGKWADYANQASHIAQECHSAKGIIPGVYYGYFNIGTLPGSTHTDVVAITLYDNAVNAEKGLNQLSETSQKITSFMTSPPRRLVCDGVVFSFKDFSLQADTAYCLASVYISPSERENCLNYLVKQQPTLGKGIIWAGAMLPRAMDTLSVFLAYKSFAHARLADNSAFLEGLTPFAQFRPRSLFGIHEWGALVKV